MAESISQAQFFAEGNPDGNVDFGINDGRGRPIIRAQLTPEEISGFATELLNASHSAVVRSGESIASLSDPETVKPCPANALNIGHTKGQGGLVIIARVGKAKIALQVPEAEALNLARSFIKAGTTSYSSLSTWALFRRVFADFFSGVASVQCSRRASALGHDDELHRLGPLCWAAHLVGFVPLNYLQNLLFQHMTPSASASTVGAEPTPSRLGGSIWALNI